MYIYMYVCMHACMHVYVCVYIYIYICIGRVFDYNTCKRLPQIPRVCAANATQVAMDIGCGKSRQFYHKRRLRVRTQRVTKST